MDMLFPLSLWLLLLLLLLLAVDEREEGQLSFLFLIVFVAMKKDEDTGGNKKNALIRFADTNRVKMERLNGIMDHGQ